MFCGNHNLVRQTLSKQCQNHRWASILDTGVQPVREGGGQGRGPSQGVVKFFTIHIVIKE